MPAEFRQLELTCDAAPGRTLMFKVVFTKPLTVSDDGDTPQVILVEGDEHDKLTIALKPSRDERFKPTVPEAPALINTCGSWGARVKSGIMLFTMMVEAALEDA